MVIVSWVASIPAVRTLWAAWGRGAMDWTMSAASRATISTLKAASPSAVGV
jgi:hypothetical protein